MVTATMRSSLASLKGQHYQVHTCRPARLQCTLHPERQARRFPTVRSPRTEISFQSIAFLADRKNVECHRFFSNVAHGWIYEKKKKKNARWRNLMCIEIFRDTKNIKNILGIYLLFVESLELIDRLLKMIGFCALER